MDTFKFFHTSHNGRTDMNPVRDRRPERIQPKSTFRMIIEVVKEEDIPRYC